MKTEIKFHRAAFSLPQGYAHCLVFNKFGDFQILIWDEEEGEFYDESNGNYFSTSHCPLWARLPENDCDELVKASTIGGVR